jgi:hypothetical protein
MKKIIYTILSVLIFSACNDDYLDRFPETECLFHLKSIPGFQFKSIPLLFRKQYLKKKGVPLSSSGLLAL